MKIEIAPWYNADGTIKSIATIQIETEKEFKILQELFFRALNTWEGCPAYIKTMADVLIHGEGMLHYPELVPLTKQREVPKTQILGELPVCSICGGSGMSHVFSNLTKPCPNDPRYQPKNMVPSNRK